MTIGQALAMLNAIQSYRRLPTPYGPGYFTKRHWRKYLSASNRKVTLRLARIPTCLRCGRKLSPDSEGDHIIATARGGKQDASNYMPLCGPCNSSKGTSDLLDWWLKDQSILGLNLDVLCSYTRLRYERGGVDEPATESMLTALEQFRPVMAEAHWDALVESCSDKVPTSPETSNV